MANKFSEFIRTHFSDRFDVSEKKNEIPKMDFDHFGFEGSFINFRTYKGTSEMYDKFQFEQLRDLLKRALCPLCVWKIKIFTTSSRTVTVNHQKYENHQFLLLQMPFFYSKCFATSFYHIESKIILRVLATNSSINALNQI